MRLPAALMSLGSLALGCGPAAVDSAPPDRPGEISFSGDSRPAADPGESPGGACHLLVVRVCDSVGEDHDLCRQMREDLEVQGITGEDESMCREMLPELEMILPLLGEPMTTTSPGRCGGIRGREVSLPCGPRLG